MVRGISRRKQELRITTVVKYNNWLGRAYFFIIRPFHGIIVKSILKHVAGDRGGVGVNKYSH